MTAPITAPILDTIANAANTLAANGDPANRKTRTRNFTTNLEYLAAVLEYLQTLARKRMAALRVQAVRGGMPKSRRFTEWDDESDKTPKSADELQNDFRRLSREVQWKHRLLQSRIDATLAAGKVILPLEDLAKQNSLTEFEKLVLALVLGPSVDNGFRRTIEAAVDNRGMEVRTVLDILCDTLEEKIRVRKIFVNTGNLLSNGLLNLAHTRSIDSEDEFMNMDLTLSRRVASLILGEYDIDDQLVSFSAVIDPEVNIDQVILPKGKKEETLELLAHRDVYLATRRQWGFDRILSYGKGTILLFSGPSGSGKTMLAHALAKASNHRLMLVDIRKVANHSHHDFEENLQRIFHEARLQSAIVFFDEADEMFTDRSCNGAMPTILREFERLDGVAILATNRKQVLDEALERRILFKLDFETPTPELREEIWRKHLPEEAPLAPDVDIKALAEEFEFTGGFIKNAVLIAMHRAMQKPQAERRIAQADLRAGAIIQRRNRLEGLTDHVTPRVGLADVVLPEDTRRQIQAILSAARQRSTVFSAWGFGKKMNLGKAITALFLGESGVGKTMTAEAIAYELGQALHPVNLAAIVSKYVGETEKNLRAVFDAGKDAQAILFFDEADALFSARLDEQTHHAHYINQQVNALLTEIEKYDGIVILATNRAEAFDQAFERGIRYRVHFPKPDSKAREAIWRGMLPPDAPLGEIDFVAVAEDYDFTGGTIKNVILRSAFEAATDGRVITEAILRRCAEEENPLQKKEKIGFKR